MDTGDFVFTTDNHDTPKPRLRQIISTHKDGDEGYRYVAATIESIRSGNPFGMCFREEHLRPATPLEVNSYIPILE